MLISYSAYFILLFNVTPLLGLVAAEGLRELLEPFGELVRSLDLPDWLIHWGHPGNMVRQTRLVDA